MFHGKHAVASLERAAAWAGITLDPAKRDLLAEFAVWLAGEGAEAGGIGPAETDRIIDRHIADALTFAAAWEAAPGQALDVGSGVGLPGIPLAIALPFAGLYSDHFFRRRRAAWLSVRAFFLVAFVPRARVRLTEEREALRAEIAAVAEFIDAEPEA